MAVQQTLTLDSLESTRRLGILIGRLAAPGDVITLEGDLGAGKTTLTQAVGQGLDVPVSCYITSPTFALMHEYPGRIPLVHMDLYRLATEEEIEDLGFDEYLHGDGKGLTMIEWPERLGSLMPGKRLNICIRFSQEETDKRHVTLTAHGDTYLKYLEIANDTPTKT